jgi:hypothetical protein
MATQLPCLALSKDAGSIVSEEFHANEILLLIFFEISVREKALAILSDI